MEKMDNATAMQLTRTGGTVLVRGFPVGGTFGIDMRSWTTGEKFQGVKMIPPGVHIVASSAADTAGMGLGAVSTTLLSIRPGAVVVLEWSVEDECLTVLCDDDAVARFTRGVRRMEFDSGLAPYPLDTCKDWTSLTSAVTQACAERIRPVEKIYDGRSHTAIESTTLGVDGSTELPLAGVDKAVAAAKAAAATDDSATIDLAAERLFFTSLPKRPEGLAGSDVTCWQMDGSKKLEIMARACGGGAGGLRELVGEMQLAFVLFIVGQNYTAFEHWKALLTLFLTAESLIEDVGHYADAMVVMCGAVAAQLEHLPSEFTVCDNALLPKLFRDFRDITSPPTPVDGNAPLREAVDALMRKVVASMGDIDGDVDDDEGPMYVDLEEQEEEEVA